jgi:hypothetical protein
VAGKVALGSKRQALLLAALASVLILAVVRWRSGGSQAPPPETAAKRPGPAGPAAIEDEAAAARGGRRASSSSKAVSPDEVPVIDPKDFDPPPARGGSETGRDLFDLREPTRPPPPTPTPRPPMPGDADYIGPLPPPPPTPMPRPPEITFKFLGSFGPKDFPIAVIQQGDEVFNARAGDTLFGKFVLRKVGYESIDVGFVGFDPGETRRLGITP